MKNISTVIDSEGKKAVLQKKNYDALLKAMTQRLPELEWKMNNLSIPFSGAALPKHLFPSFIHQQPQQLVDGIKEEITRLEQEKSLLSALYLARKISQKIHVLVTYCNEHNTRTSEHSPSMKNLMDELCTRNQFVQKTEEKIQRLLEQRQALEKRLSNHAHQQETLALTKELGTINKQLTLAKEALNTFGIQ